MSRFFLLVIFVIQLFPTLSRTVEKLGINNKRGKIKNTVDICYCSTVQLDVCKKRGRQGARRKRERETRGSMVQPTGNRGKASPSSLPSSPPVLLLPSFPFSAYTHTYANGLHSIFPLISHPANDPVHPVPICPAGLPFLPAYPTRGEFAVPCRCSSEEVRSWLTSHPPPSPTRAAPPPPGRTAARRRRPRPCKASSTPARRSSPPPRRVSCRRPTPSRASPPSSVRTHHSESTNCLVEFLSSPRA
jgi:hypothetical protein